MLDQLESRFKERTKEWLKKDFQKHAQYLENVVLRGMDNIYEVDVYESALETFKDDPDAGIEQIYDCLKVALEQKHQKELEKGEKILATYHSGSLKIEKEDDDKANVESETKAGQMYTVNLKDGECNCQSAKTLSYAGLWCKHACAAYLLHGDSSFTSSRKQKVIISSDKAILVSELEIVQEDGCSFITYLSQRLKIRKETPNALIPKEVTFFLEGKAPQMVMYALEKNEPLLLIGESGTGKSKMIEALAHATNTPLVSPCGHSEVTIEHLLGCFIARYGNTIWQNGVIPDAMRKGYWLLLEEVNAIDPGILKLLNELLDKKQITITIAGKPKKISASESFRLICTSNPTENPIYRGIEPMSFEFFDRFPVVVKMDYLSPSAEASVIRKLTSFSDDSVLQKMIEFAGKVREGERNSEIFATVTTRALVQWAEKIEFFGIKEAAHATILHKFDTQSYAKALDLLNAYFK